MKKITYAAIYLFLLVLLAPMSVLGQATASGTVLGTISDSSQAVVNGAEVTITSPSSGATRTLVTNNLGSYRFDSSNAFVDQRTLGGCSTRNVYIPDD